MTVSVGILCRNIRPRLSPYIKYVKGGCIFGPMGHIESFAELLWVGSAPPSHQNALYRKGSWAGQAGKVGTLGW